MTEHPVTREGPLNERPGSQARMLDQADAGPRRRGGRRGGRDREGGEQPTVPRATFTSYYGRPIVKAAVWHDDIAAYLFTGGLAAGSALIAAGADATDAPALRRGARFAAFGAAAASGGFLVHDLGRPMRFLNMLRVAKPSSPMSVGTWIFSAFSAFCGLAMASELAPALPRHGVRGAVRRGAPWAGRFSGLAAAALAPAMATYTAVLIADTATPSWHAVHGELPFAFGASALASGSGVGLLVAPVSQAAGPRRLAVGAAAAELAAMHVVQHGHGLLSEPYRDGEAGRLLRAGAVLTATGALGAALLGRRSRALSAAAGGCLLAGSVCTRFGVFRAGVASARDPKYVVIPQRERLAAREEASAAATG